MGGGGQTRGGGASEKGKPPQKTHTPDYTRRDGYDSEFVLREGGGGNNHEIKT